MRPAGARRPQAVRPGRRRSRSTPNMGTRWASFVVRRPVAVLLLGVVGLGAIGRPGRPAGTGPARRRLAAHLHHPAPGLRPAVRGLRPRLQRPADGRRRRARTATTPRRPSPRSADEIKGLKDVVTVTPAALNKAGDTADHHRDPGLQAVLGARPRTWCTPSGTRAPDIKADTDAKVLVTGAPR